MRERMDELQRRIRGVEELEKRVEKLEQQVAELEDKAPSRRPSRSRSSTPPRGEAADDDEAGDPAEAEAAAATLPAA